MGTEGFPESQAPARGGVENCPSELKCWQGNAPRMPGPHRHDDIEVNLVFDNPLRYLFGGTPVQVRPAQVGIFWAAMPHRLIDCADNWGSYVCWLHLPLGIVLQWGLPEPVIAEILRGRPLLRNVADSHRLDAETFAQWATDLASGAPERRDIALLEIQAQLRRLVHATPEVAPPPHEWTDADDVVRHASAMARFAATHFREPVTAADVAASAHLHPNYAMTIFHRVLDTTIGAYLTQWRVAEAQRLLLTTPETTSEIAAAAGFGSPSAFYSAFARACGQPPGAYRRSYRAAS